ncbi:hypothetical protein ACN38_g12119, partial [Penicillium nordicum]
KGEGGGGGKTQRE